MIKNYFYTRRLMILIAFFLSVLFIVGISDSRTPDTRTYDPVAKVPSILEPWGDLVDFTNSSVDLNMILSGGPSKDGIPSIDDPDFVGFGTQGISKDTQVIVVEGGGEYKVYPYNILAWHEIVNDVIDGTPVAVTFCPLCGAAIVYERELSGGELVEFGVSGLLYESNLLMYSREDSETLWSQSIGEAIAGKRTGEKLTHYPFDLMTYGEARAKHPTAMVLSEDTGFGRDYQGTPYSGYSDSEALYFPVSVNDQRFPAKEIFYVVPLEGNSIAIRRSLDDGVYDVPDSDIKIHVTDGEIVVRWGDAELPGYFEMWFSWATHHQENSIIIER